MRALAGFYDFVTNNQSQLVIELEALIKYHESGVDDTSRKHLAKQFAARLIDITSLGFIAKPSLSVSSDSLMEDIHTAVTSNPSIAFRLIEIGVVLECGAPLPRELLLKLRDDIGKEYLAIRMLQLLVIRHMYMFKTSESDKQWLASKLDINISLQHAIEFNTNKTKRIK